MDVETEAVAGTLWIDEGMPPSQLASQPAIESLCERGLRRVVVRRPLLEPADDAATVAWIRTLRDLASCAVDVDWRVSGRATIPLALLAHLPPPQGHGERGGGFRYGALYWRQGPGFVTVRDSRGAGVRLFVLDDPPSQGAFLRCVRGVRKAEVPAASWNELRDEGLVLELGEWLIALPYRMRHWPVPFRAI